MAHISDIRTKTADELKELAVSLRKELFNLRFQAASGEEVKISRFKESRRDLARIKTVMNDPQQKTVGAAKETKAKKASAKKKASEE